MNATSYVKPGFSMAVSQRKMLKLTADGIIAFSLKSLQAAGYIGGAITVGSIVSLLLLFFIWLFKSTDCAGIWFFALPLVLLGHGVVLLLIGILGTFLLRHKFERNMKSRGEEQN